MTALALLAALPLLLAVSGLFPRLARWLPPAGAVIIGLQVPVALGVTLPVLAGVRSAQPQIDSVGAVFLLLTTVVAAAALIQAAFLFPAERLGEHGVSDRRLGLFYTLCGLFLLAMYAVLLARNLGYLWIAMEAPTLMSAPLVYFHRTRDAAE